MNKIAIVGKGGVGKSFITYALSKFFAQKANKVLVVDCDESNKSLFRLFGFAHSPKDFMDFLGGKKAVQQKLIKKFKDKEAKINILEKGLVTLESIPTEFIQQDGNIFLINIGKISHPMEGCACPMGVVSREFLEKIELKKDELVIVDTEAGVEHFGRGIEQGIDVVLAIAEPYLDSIEVAKRAYFLAKDMGKRAYLLFNKVTSNLKERLEKTLEQQDIELLGFIDFYPEVYASALDGKIPENKSVFSEIEKIGEKIYGI